MMLLKFALLCIIAFSVVFETLPSVEALTAADLTQLNTWANSLPTASLIGYWPFSSQFGLRDGSANKIDAVLWNNTGSTATGPFGIANGAVRTLSTFDPPGYLNFTSPLLNFGASSWTIASYINTNGYTNKIPIFEYFAGDCCLGCHLWQDAMYTAIQDSLFFNPINGNGGNYTYGTMAPCMMTTGWQFVGVTYDHSTMSWKHYCGSAFGSTTFHITGDPTTTNTLMAGYRMWTPQPTAVSVSYACTSIFSAALTGPQMTTLKNVCKYIQNVTCGTNCLPDTCRGRPTASLGYVCDCIPGYTGSDCLSPACNCQHGGTCVAPNTCVCVAGWTDAMCSTAVCNSTCIINNLAAELPSFVGYWPFSSQFGLRDTTANKIDAVWWTTAGTQVAGPFGTANTAVRTLATSSPPGYLNWTSPLINFGTGSWTWSAYINTYGLTSNIPIFEYHVDYNNYGAQLWQWNPFGGSDANILFFDPPQGNYTYASIYCPLTGGWQFVGFSFDAGTNTWHHWCNDTWGPTTYVATTPMTTSNTLMGGYRSITAQTVPVSISFACVSMFGTSLTADQMMTSRQLCQLMQGVTCSVNCVAATCRPAPSAPRAYTCDSCLSGWTGNDCLTPICSPTCANGGTCIYVNLCQCTNGWIGQSCSTISALAATLPPFVGYWPFSSQFALRDSGPYLIDAVYSNSTTGSAQVVGPFGKPNSAAQTASTVTPSAYLNWTSPHLNLGATSWTMALYVKMGSSAQSPILEYYNGPASYSTQLWHNSASTPYVPNYLYFQPQTAFNPVNNNTMPCGLSTGWQFVGVVYDMSAQTWQAFCNESFGLANPITTAPQTNNTLMGGYRVNYAKQVAFACVSIFSQALSLQQLLNVKQLCFLAQNVTCGANCVANTCRFSASNPNGYTCDACLPAYSGPDCTSSACLALPCQNGGACIGPNNCTCPANFTGAQCSIPICSPPCQNGGNCTMPGMTCNCTSQWSGSTCSVPICVSGCANGGTCINPDTCGCTASWTGLTCTTPTCTPDCANGGTCIAVNTCSCTAQWTGPNCTTPVCSPVCLNGGTCSSPNVCSCPTSSYIGPLCQYPVCSPACPVGYTCNAPNQCINTAASLCDHVKTDLGPVCTNWSKAGQCLSNPGFMWTLCQSTCTKWATCECSSIVPFTPIDSNCTCGEMAAEGLCEIDAFVASNCTYTCGRRLNPSNNCSTYPLEISLPPHASWKLGAPPPSYFYGQGAFMQTAVITCDAGYTPASNADTGMHVCDPFSPNATTGNWAVINTDVPQCLEAACPDPPNIDGSYIVNTTIKANFFAGDKVTYYCNSGLTMRYAIVPEATCTFTGPTGWTWADNKPQCMLPPCHGLIEGINTYFNVSTNQTGGVATYSCLLGYNPTVDSALFVKTCQPGGSWTPTGKPACDVVKCGNPPVEENSFLTGTKDSYQYGDSVTTRCSKGSTSLYIEPGTESTPLASVSNYCTEFGTWSTNLLSCLLVQCQSPQTYEISSYRILNSTTELQNLLYGMVISFECDWNQGYEPDANQTSHFAYWTCNENSTWDRQPLYCSQSALMKVIKPKKQEAYESSTAVAAASSVLAVLAFFLGVVVCLDYMTISRDFRRLRHNLRHFVRRLRDQARLKELHEKRNQLRHQLDKERFLDQVNAAKEQQQLAAAGYAVGGADGEGTSNPAPLFQQAASSWATRPMTADNFARLKSDHHHVEGEMELPEDIQNRFGPLSGSQKSTGRAMTAK